MIIAIDFDGTIVQDSYPSIGMVNPSAKRVINRLFSEGHYIIIWTCRTGDHLTQAVNFLLSEGIRFSRINENEPVNLKLYKEPSRKVYADVYIDDKNLGGFPGWVDVEKWMDSTNEL